MTIFSRLRRVLGATFEWFRNFPHLVGTLTGVENCETIQKLHPALCVSVSIIFFLKSRPIYVNVDSLHLDFPYF